MLTCLQCGLDNAEGSEQCSRCGRRLADGPEVSAAATLVDWAKNFGRAAGGAATVSPVPTSAPASKRTPIPDESPAFDHETPEAEPPEPAPVVLPRLVVVRGERLGAEYVILEGTNYIGRSDDQAVDIDLDGQEAPERTWASRRHAAVILEGGMLAIEDLKSLNGTFVNRARLHPGQHRVLQAGDVVQIGTVQLRVAW